jgi:iron-sulfur cluster assembly protein
VFEDQGIKLYVDRASFPALDGTRVDFVRKGLNESFQFQNPNVKAECGCGESFTV